MSKQYSIVFIVLLILIYGVGAFADLIDVDAAQYAAISMEMLGENEYFTFTERGIDYLDKPPFVFWMVMFSFKIFGITTFTYKIPSLIFTGVSLLYTYRFSFHYYGKEVAKMATGIAVVSAGVFWMNNDAKTDVFIMASVIASVYHLKLLFEKGRLKDALLSGLFVGIGMLSKGPMGLVFPAVIVGVDLLFKKNLKQLLNWRLVIVLLIVSICLLPMVLSLYWQFDIHPEKIVNERK